MGLFKNLFNSFKNVSNEINKPQEAENKEVENKEQPIENIDSELHCEEDFDDNEVVEEEMTGEEYFRECVKDEIKHGRETVKIYIMSMGIFLDSTELIHCSEQVTDNFLIDLNLAMEDYKEKMYYFLNSLDDIEEMVDNIDFKKEGATEDLDNTCDMICDMINDITDEIRDCKVFAEVREIKKYKNVAYKFKKHHQ